ncbi:serine hydrolase domain-containing protein [Alteromonas sp. CYL-A6]|uniref:serine hydrolase domain-containing protein n=1 Tax=Alteromonas nitratireducens TaxID=3390813 RepID=UPI0034B88526
MKAIIYLASLLPLTLAAQTTETDTTLNAYAAGYVANFTCSATFNGGKTAGQIREDELTGIYPLIADRVSTLRADVDTDNKRVVVAYDNGKHQRISVWRPRLGCVDLPVGASLDDAARVMSPFAESQPEPDDGSPWTTRQTVNTPTGNAQLDKVIANAFTRHYGEGARTSAVLIATPDRIVAEHYKAGFTPDTAQRTWSVAKSIGASVIGVAVAQGRVDVKKPAGLENWSHPLDPRGKITLENLLHMASGLDSNVAGNRTDRLYMGGGLVSDTATETALEVAPGTRWKYANNDTLLALRTLRETFSDETDYLTFPYTELLDKIGMKHTYLETDWQSDFILSSQVWTTARDLARLGLLHLNNGRWGNQQILPENWLTYISTPAPAQPGEGRPGYGAQWWLYNERFSELPDDTLAARGNRGQFLVIIPSRQLVIVRRGYDLAGQPGFSEHDFTRDVLKALQQ